MRKYMIGLLFAGATLVPNTTMAQTWSGPYVGAHGGFAWMDWDGVFQFEGKTDSASFSDPSQTVDGDGGYGGLQVGYNWQLANRIVLGIEADISWGNLDGEDTFDTDKTGPAVFSKTLDLSVDRFGTARVRVGYNAGSFLPYLTGGLAWGHTDGDLAVAYIPNGKLVGTSYASTSENHFGWTIGAGVEYAVAKNISIKAEYLHIDLGEENYDFEGKVFNGAPFNTDSFPADLKIETVRIGLNYALN